MKTAHLDYETLADLAEGLLDDEQAASANDHLVDCAECLGRSADLADVSRLLAEAPLPPLPVELAERIDNAIAAEASSSPAASAPSHRRHLRLLSAAAAALVAVGGGTLVGKELLSSTSPEYTKSQAASDPGVSAAGAPAPSAPPELRPDRRLPATGGPRFLASGTDYREGTLASQVGTALKFAGATGTTEIGLAGCLAKITKGAKGEDPVLVDQARYNGRSATLIVLRGSDPGELDVWVVGSNCSAAATDLITRTRADG